MLEKLIYKNAVVKDWYFDVTMCREAEAFIRQMAAQGYRLKKLTRDYRALFVKDEEIRKKVGSEKYDIVVANILAEVLVPLTPVVARTLRPGGIYITSGILNGKEELVEEAVRNAGMEVLEVTRQGEWMSVTARRKAADR